MAPILTISRTVESCGCIYVDTTTQSNGWDGAYSHRVATCATHKRQAVRQAPSHEGWEEKLLATLR
jgi:hypothetical protein